VICSPGQQELDQAWWARELVQAWAMVRERELVWVEEREQVWARGLELARVKAEVPPTARELVQMWVME